MRGSTIVILAALALGGLLLASTLHLIVRQNQAPDRMQNNRELVGSLDLTDLCLSTEARYTRHLTQADRHAAFQDHPGALEHFPSGSILFNEAVSGSRN